MNPRVSEEWVESFSRRSKLFGMVAANLKTSFVVPNPISHAGAAADLSALMSGLSAEYGLGASRAELRESLLVAIQAASIRWRFAVEGLPVAKRDYIYRPGRDVEKYRHVLWLVSLSLALEVDDVAFDELVDAIVPFHGDRVVGLLIQSRRPDFPVSDVFALKGLGAALTKPWTAPDPVKALASYLVKWPAFFKGEDAKWAAALIEGRRSPHYFGHWAFEAVGVVKALGLDDSGLLELEHYPAGIFHDER